MIFIIMLNYFTWIPEVINSRKDYLDELDCFKNRSLAIRQLVNARDCGIFIYFYFQDKMMK